jgi:uncharacterized membrane protein YphA (DoxX/SURF4 family)
MKPSYQKFRRHTAVILGVVFLISGLLKLCDPVGTMLIVTEYFKFLGMPSLIPAAKAVGIAVACLECFVAIGLITGVLRKTTAIITYSLLGVFTLLTLALWIKNPEMDCGCFGQAIHLTHAQSFWKNVVLLALAVVAFTPFKDFGRPKGHKRVAAIVASLAIILAAIYSNTHLPVVDFTAFNWGSQLFASLDDNAEEADFRRAPILSFRDAEGNYLDEEAARGRVIIFSAFDAPKADWERLEQQYRLAQQTSARPMLLVSATGEEMASCPLPADIEPYYSDYKTLITLNRSNGGGTYFYHGEVVHKWAASSFPDKLQEDVADDPVALSTRHVTRRRLTAQGFCVGLLAIFLLL